MRSHSRAGRPRAELPEPSHPLTERIRRIVDVVHRGKVLDASRLTGIPYPTLNELYVGRTVNPNTATLEAFRKPYDIPMSWLFGESGAEASPQTGRFVLLPPHPKASVRRRELRRVEIPFAAWSLYHVFSVLERRLNSAEPSVDRPIVGEASGYALTFRLATFLLQPLLAAEKAGEPGVIVTADGEQGDDAGPRERWVESLLRLGDLWKSTLSNLLADAGLATP